MMCRLEKNINENINKNIEYKNINENINKNIESLRAEMRANLAEIKNAMNQMQSKLDALTARVNEAENELVNWRMGW